MNQERCINAIELAAALKEKFGGALFPSPSDSHNRCMTWNKASAIDFFHKRGECSIVIKEEVSRIFIRGEIVHFEELDLCSTTLFEATLQLLSPGLKVAITFHDEFLGAHLLITLPHSQEPQLSLPYQIPYNQLILEEVS